jgi:mRNA interferase RelE/StbE
VSYAVAIERAAQKSLAKISPPHRARIIRAIEALATDPRPAGVKKLRQREAWRLRVGTYRVIYEIHEDEVLVLVVRVRHRREAYR